MTKHCEICKNIIQKKESFVGNKKDGYAHIECLDNDIQFQNL